MVGFGASAGTQAVQNEALALVLGGRDTSFYKGHYLKLSALCFIVLITSMTNGYDGSMMNGLQSLDTWKLYFNNPQGGLLGLFNAIQNIGGLAGLPLAPFVSDRFGRRTGIVLGSLLMMVGVILQSAAHNVGMFIGARFMVGFGLSFASIAAPVLLTEMAHPAHRAQWTSLYNTSWYLGSIVAAWTTYGTFRMTTTWSWRIPSILQGIPSLLQLFLIWLIPESPRWLVSRGRDEQAIKVITKYHCNNEAEDPLIAFEYEEIKEALRIERAAEKGSSWKALFTKRGNLRRLRVIVALGFFSQWSGNGLVSYYLTLVLDGIGIKATGTQTLINGILQIYNYGTAIIGALTVERAGRRILFLTSTGGMCLAFTLWTICSALYSESAAAVDAAGNPIHPDKAAGHGVLAFIFIYYGFYNIALNPHLVSYTVEIMPFAVRAKGLMVMQYCVSASLVFNQYVNPIALNRIGWKYYIFYCIWLAFECIYLYFTVIETKGKNGPLSLEEVAQLFDGPGLEPLATTPELGEQDLKHLISALKRGAQDVYSVVTITVPISDAKLQEIQRAVPTVHYHPDAVVPDDHAAETDFWYTNWMGLPASVSSLEQIPRTKLIQLSSAGANNWLSRELMQSEEAKRQMRVCSASGIHALSIPQYIVANVINLYMKLQLQTFLARSEARWPERSRVLEVAAQSGREIPGNRFLFGKTVGMLGYGHIARETARLFKAFHCKVIAANSNGDRRGEAGYAIPGTGDPDGSIPLEFYSTRDRASFREFLSQCDVLVASLPSTPQSQWLLTAEDFALLPDGAVFVNVGRGDHVRSEEIIQALDAPGGLWGVVLDVTDPEPLPPNHPLFTHPSAIVTPHTSGSFEGYFDSGADVLLRQAERLRARQAPINVVDPEKGY